MKFGLIPKNALAKTVLPLLLVVTYAIAGCQPTPQLAGSAVSPSALVPSTTQAPLSLATLPVDFTDEHGVRMKLVEAGSFEMGNRALDALLECQKLMTVMNCRDNWFNDEEPQHSVYLDAFYIDLTEVTNAMYQRCVEAGACTEPSEKRSFSRDSYYGNPAYADYPVIFVSWKQARIYCEWRGARLPYEAEWEKAARGTDGRLYPWGNEFCGNLSNFCDRNCRNGWANRQYDDGRADTAPVGSFAEGASPFGLLDMAGNVWEWVWDQYLSTYYADSPSQNPHGPDSGDFRVLRGGSWYDMGYNLRVTNRDWNDPANTLNDRGFRCARSP